jgi:hypothetical protein
LPPGFNAAFKVGTTHLRWDNHKISKRHRDLSVICGSTHQIYNDVLMSCRKFANQRTDAALAGRDRYLNALEFLDTLKEFPKRPVRVEIKRSNSASTRRQFGDGAHRCRSLTGPTLDLREGDDRHTLCVLNQFGDLKS